jgi:hypothetical protein
LALVNLYWNIGRIIAQDIQKNEKRAGYGEQLLDSLATSLAQEYGHGYSISNLNDIRRFYEAFKILQTPSVEFPPPRILQTVSGKSVSAAIRQALPVESSARISIDFNEHFRLRWSHYRLLLSQNDPLKRKFYFEQAAILLKTNGQGRPIRCFPGNPMKKQYRCLESFCPSGSQAVNLLLRKKIANPSVSMI